MPTFQEWFTNLPYEFWRPSLRLSPAQTHRLQCGLEGLHDRSAPRRGRKLYDGPSGLSLAIFFRRRLASGLAIGH
jgi:hypothetical protein